MESPNFDVWLKEKARHGSRRIKTLYLEQLMEFDVRAWIQEHSEVEAVDFLLRLRDMLVCAIAEHRAGNQQHPFRPSSIIHFIGYGAA